MAKFHLTFPNYISKFKNGNSLRRNHQIPGKWKISGRRITNKQFTGPQSFLTVLYLTDSNILLSTWPLSFHACDTWSKPFKVLTILLLMVHQGWTLNILPNIFLHYFFSGQSIFIFSVHPSCIKTFTYSFIQKRSTISPFIKMFM